LENFGKKLRPARDKIISHLDRRTIHDGKPLGGAEPQEWARYWSNLEQFVEILYQRYFDMTVHIRAATASTDAAVLRGGIRGKSRYSGVPLPLSLPPELQ
jgi:hypothetical protein